MHENPKDDYIILYNLSKMDSYYNPKSSTTVKEYTQNLLFKEKPKEFFLTELKQYKK
jgi:hypothetical protein